MVGVYKGPIKLRNEDYYFYFKEGVTKLQKLVAPIPPMENPERPGWWSNAVLGEWGGTLTILGYDLHQVAAGLFELETKYHSGRIFIYKTELDGAHTRVWFDGSGKLAFFSPDSEVKHTQTN